MFLDNFFGKSEFLSLFFFLFTWYYVVVILRCRVWSGLKIFNGYGAVVRIGLVIAEGKNAYLLGNQCMAALPA